MKIPLRQHRLLITGVAVATALAVGVPAAAFASPEGHPTAAAAASPGHADRTAAVHTGTARKATAGTTATVSATAAQTMAGFGASGDWWVNPVQYFPPSAQRHIADLLFTSQGLALSQYRYNIGGGGVGADVPTGGESELGFADRAPQTFYVAPGIYNWTHDAGGTTFLRYAAADHVPEIVANVNSAPWAFTTNGQSCGGELNSSDVQAYAGYLTTVIKHIHDAWGITIPYISPMNEPDYTRSDCTQEGMEVPPALRATVVQDLGKDLAAQAPYTHIIADESSDVSSQFIPELPQWMGVAGTSQYVAALATHTYDFPSDATMAQAATLAQQYGKQLWATEICCMVYNGGSSPPSYGEQFDPTITGGLSLAQIIYEDLTSGNMSAFDWWVALSAAEACDPTQASCMMTVNSTGWNDGLLYFDPNFATDHNYNVYPTKRFYTLGQFSRFVRPGAVRHDVTGTPSGVQALAFTSHGQWQVVVINQNAAGSGPATFSLQLPGHGTLRPEGTYQTSATASLSPRANPPVQGSTATLTTPAQSVTTYLLGQAG
jgi:O-glycosyl hydrolase